MALDIKTVNQTFLACLAIPRKRGIQRASVQVAGTHAVFDKAKLDEVRKEIYGLLAELPKEFHAQGGRGWPLRNACLDKAGVQWTRSMMDVERLMALGRALGWAGPCMHESLTRILTKNEPYWRVNLPATPA